MFPRAHRTSTGFAAPILTSRPGRQREPKPHVHNSGWVQCPGADILGKPERHDQMKPYVAGVIDRLRDDERVLAWDLYNEPGNDNSRLSVSPRI